MYGRKLNAYSQTNLKAELSVADPYIITKMLYQGVFERLAQAKGAIERGDLAVKASKLSSASAILENLKSTIDFSLNKSLAQNLYDLYSYMLERIADASLQVSVEPIDSALKVLVPLKTAWDNIPVSARSEAVEKRNPQASIDSFNHDDALARGVI